MRRSIDRRTALQGLAAIAGSVAFPCLTDGFYATMPNCKAIDLARTMRFVRDHPARHLQQVSTLPSMKQVELEDANVRASIEYARSDLGL